MFGLDARIALAIFGALSVISGAALYSAIQQSKVVRVLVDINEYEKAVEQFMLDTGEDLSVYNTNNMVSNDLIEDPGLTGWNGPYLPYELDSGSAVHKVWLKYTIDGARIGSRKLESDLGTSSYIVCSTSPCYYWVQVPSVDNSLVRAFDVYVDGVEDPDNGKVRYLATNGNSIYYKGPLMLKQP